MISIIVIAIFAVACMVMVALQAHETIDALRKQNAQLYADNQALMTALAQANGQRLHFDPVTEKAPVAHPPRPTPAPYWATKQTEDIKIGDKTITVSKQSLR